MEFIKNTTHVLTCATPKADNGKTALAIISLVDRPTEGTKKCQKYMRQFTFIVLLIAVLTLSLALYVLLTKYSPPEVKTVTEVPKTKVLRPNIETATTPTQSTNLTAPSSLKIISRSEWMAQPPTQPPQKLTTPVPYVIIWHTATENCSSNAQCTFDVRFIQTFHMESSGWWDIGYNFLVGGDGNAYEGRGWTSVGAHTYGYNDRSVGIAFIGTFTQHKPPEAQMTACKQLIEQGVSSGFVSKGYKLLAARQLQASEAPGKALYEEMNHWPHWSQQP